MTLLPDILSRNLTYKMMVWKMIFLFQRCIILSFHVNLAGFINRYGYDTVFSLQVQQSNLQKLVKQKDNLSKMVPPPETNVPKKGTISIWYIYLHVPEKSTIHVGKYTLKYIVHGWYGKVDESSSKHWFSENILVLGGVHWKKWPLNPEKHGLEEAPKGPEY